jgi:hypothetical protein
MALKGKTRSIDPIGRMPNLHGPMAATDFLAGMPPLDSPESLRVMDGEKPNPSSHPNKTNPGSVKYYGGDA